MNETSAAALVRLAHLCAREQTAEAVLTKVAPVLVELAAARAVLVTRPDGAVEMVVTRPGAVLGADPMLVAVVGHDLGAGLNGLTDLPLHPTAAAAGITRIAGRTVAGGTSVLLVAWDREPGETDVLGLEAALAVLDERLARLRAEDELVDLTLRVDNAQQLANMGDYDWHIATDTNRWSDQLYRIYGYEPQAFNPSYERFLSHIHPDDRERVAALHQHAYNAGEPYEMTERVIRPDGSVRYLSSNGQVLRDETGTPTRMRGTCIDITERVLAEQARERLTARFRSMVESCPDAILVLDGQSWIVQANRRAHELLNGDPIGTMSEQIAVDLRIARQGVQARALDGRTLELDVVVADLSDVNGEGLVAVYLRDAAERHVDEARAAALREAQVRHRQALEINDDVIQGLTAAILAMEQNDLPASTSYLERTLWAARRLMNDWTGGSESTMVEPGSLVRTAASTITEAPAEAGRCQPCPSPGSGLNRNVLVVDDSDNVRTLLCAQLGSLGNCTVVGQAADGEEAIRLAVSLQPDLVILDLSMPRMDGLQALPLILDAVPGVRVVVMSGFDQRSLADQVLAAGAVRYVEKGLRMNLAAVIDEVFQVA